MVRLRCKRSTRAKFAAIAVRFREMVTGRKPVFFQYGARNRCEMCHVLTVSWLYLVLRGRHAIHDQRSFDEGFKLGHVARANSCAALGQFRGAQLQVLLGQLPPCSLQTDNEAFRFEDNELRCLTNTLE